MQNQGFIIAREGFKWIAIGSVLTLFLALLGAPFLALIMGGVTVFITFFFRNPNRQTPEKKEVIVSPADGKVCKIQDAFEKQFLKEERKRVSIFMSVFNCHVNRSPTMARVIDIHYQPGKFHLANVDKASNLNEQNIILIEDESRNRFVLVQIAGFIARRIVSYIKVGDSLRKGERLGIIQFGSRVDVYLPKNVKLKIKEGDTVRGGETILGEMNEN